MSKLVRPRDSGPIYKITASSTVTPDGRSYDRFEVDDESTVRGGDGTSARMSDEGSQTHDEHAAVSPLAQHDDEESPFVAATGDDWDPFDLPFARAEVTFIRERTTGTSKAAWMASCSSA
jgi:hypothetical protein